METTTTRLKSGRTSRTKASKAFKNVPTALLLKKKAECDARALKIVERMMEPKVDVDWLLSSLSAISQCHMEDVAEERSIVKLCGYVLCDNPLTKVVAKRYQISTLRNKVYDIDKVRNYCSYGCYKAAKHLTEQVQTSPLWLRDSEEKPTFHLLAKKNNTRFPSPPGIEIDLLGIQLPSDEAESQDEAENQTHHQKENDSGKKHSARWKGDEESRTPICCDKERNQNGSFTELDSVATEITKVIASQSRDENSTEQPLKDAEETQTKSEGGNSDAQSLRDVEDIQAKPREEHATEQLQRVIGKLQNSHNENISLQTSTTDAANADPNPSKLVRKSSERRTERRRVKESPNIAISFETVTSRVEKCLREWITERTLSLLHGEAEEQREIIEGVKREEKYAILCKKLNRLQLEEEREESEYSGDLRPAPDLSALREEAKGLELKVRAFWQGKTVIDPADSKLSECSSEKNNQNVDTILPMLDLHAPNALRRRIFLEKLNKVMPDLLRALVAENSNVSTYNYTAEKSSSVKVLVSTFALSATNITFKTAEWTLVSLFIIKLLGIMDPRTRYLLSRKQAQMHISMILMSYKLQSNYLDNLIASVTSPPDVENTEIQQEV